MLLEIFWWWFLIEILGFLALPIIIFTCKNLPDKGYSVSKIVSILLLSYFTWIFSHFIGYNFLSISLSIFVLILSFIWLGNYHRVFSFFKENKETIKKMEIVFLGFFLFFSILRAHTPDINGLEKFSDFAIINGILRSDEMPPDDTWLSGENINYHYFGHFILTTLTKISHLPSNYTFNLGLASTFALLALASFGIGFNLTKNYKFALLTIFLIVLMSNLFGYIQSITFAFPSLKQPFINYLNLEYPLNCCINENATFLKKLTTIPVWSSTRIIPGTINEFPYSDFLFGELHPHAISLPFQLLFLVLLLNLFLSKGKFFNIFGKIISQKIASIFLISLSLGSLFMINRWDFPIYFLMFGIAFVLINLERIKFNQRSLINLLFPLGIVWLLSFLLFIPFYLSVKSSTPLGIVNEKTEFFHFFIIFSVFIFIIALYFISKLKKDEIFFLFLTSAFIAYTMNT
ncbi:hypothetical protein DRN69_08630, partial [Candidatus Pacearchaeota archaeon]